VDGGLAADRVQESHAHGACSPTRICKKVMMKNETPIEIMWLTSTDHQPGTAPIRLRQSQAHNRVDQNGERRFAHPAQAEARHRDPQLRCGEVTVEMGELL
jgi:hypothetical protein